MASRPMIIQTQFGSGLPPHGMSGPSDTNMHRSPSHGRRGGRGQRHRHDRSHATSPLRNPPRSSGRRIPPRAPAAPSAAEYSRELVRRRPSVSPSVSDMGSLPALVRHRQSAHVEYHNLRDDDLASITENEARKRLISYIAIRLQKRHTSDEHDDLGRPVQESWQDAVHYRVPGMGKEDIVTQILTLNREEGGVVERKKNMSEFIQTQLEKASMSLESQERDRRFQYTLSQFDKKVRKVERYELEPDEYTHARDFDKRRRGSSGKRKPKGGKSLFEPAKPARQKYKQTVSVTAYFKREPLPHINCRQLLHDLIMRDDRDEVEEVEEDEAYEEELSEDDYYSEDSLPQTPVHVPPRRQDLPFPAIIVPPNHPTPQSPHQYPQHAPPPHFSRQPFANAEQNGPSQQNMPGSMPPMGPPQQHPHVGGPHPPPPGPPPGFAQQPTMQQPAQFNGPPPTGGPPPPPPAPPHPHRVSPHMGQPMGPPMGPLGGPPRPLPGGPSGGPPVARQGLPLGADGRPLDHPGHGMNQPHQPPFPFQGPRGGAESSRSSEQGSIDRDGWSGGEEESTELSSVEPQSPPRRHAPYKPGHFGIPSQPRRSSSPPYHEDEGLFLRKPAHERPSRSPSSPLLGPSGESHYERRRRECAPAPRIVQGTRDRAFAGRARRDDNLSDVEERLERMRIGGDDGRDRARQYHGRRRPPVHSRDRDDRSRTPERRPRSRTPERRHRDNSHRRGYEQKPLRRSDDARERHRRMDGGRWEGPRREIYEPRHHDDSPRRHEHPRHRVDAYNRR